MSPRGVTAFPGWAGSQATSPTSARPAASVPPPPPVIPLQTSSNEEPLPLSSPSPTLPAKVPGLRTRASELQGTSLTASGPASSALCEPEALRREGIC